ncbi:MAG: hypothetical protein K0B09_09920 [Bacteroidales bacterium]|nr:hypothetical protein [Bacteroidales bacterium]
METFGKNENQKIKAVDVKQEFLGFATFEPLVYQAAAEVRYVEMLALLDKAKAEISKIITGHRVDFLIKKITQDENNQN